MMREYNPLYEKWQCQYCGTPIGYLGRFFLWAFRLTPTCAKGERALKSQEPPHG